MIMKWHTIFNAITVNRVQYCCEKGHVLINNLSQTSANTTHPPSCAEYLNTAVQQVWTGVEIDVVQGWVKDDDSPRLTYYLTGVREGLACSALWAEYYPPTDKTARSRIAYINRVQKTSAEKILCEKSVSRKSVVEITQFPSISEFLAVGFCRYMQVIAGAREVRLWVDPYADLIFSTRDTLTSMKPESLREKVYEPWFNLQAWGWCLLPASFPALDWPTFTDCQKNESTNIEGEEQMHTLTTKLADIKSQVEALQAAATKAFAEANIFVITFPTTHVSSCQCHLIGYIGEEIYEHKQHHSDLYTEGGFSIIYDQAQMEQQDLSCFTGATFIPDTLPGEMTRAALDFSIRTDVDVDAQKHQRKRFIANTNAFLEGMKRNSSMKHYLIGEKHEDYDLDASF